MTIPRSGHTATLLPNGKVLVAGGVSGSSKTASSELYDPATATWSPTGSMNLPRSGHTATLLRNGKVLVVAGDSTFKSAELYDSATGTWTTTGITAVGREFHTATLLPSGKVLLVGTDVLNENKTSVELYDPATGQWSFTGSLNIGRFQHTATSLSNGKVLITGGSTSTNLTASTELYDPVTEIWLTTGNLAVARTNHSATLLDDGRVLVAGGFFQGDLSSAEIYDPAGGKWASAGSFTLARHSHTATLLPNGRVFLVGGIFSSYAQDTSEEYEPDSAVWADGVNTDRLRTDRSGHTATLLGNGQVLAAGGDNHSGTRLASAELAYGKVTPFIPITSSLNPSEKGEIVTFTATVSNLGAQSTGTIQFQDNGADLGPLLTLDAMSSASYSTSSLAVGKHNIIAVYSGDANGTATYDVFPDGQTVYAPSSLGNISTRVNVGVSENVLIAGFIIQGTSPKRVMIRAIGPSLTNFGVGNVLSNPQLELHDTSATIALNDNWQTTQVGGVIQGDQVQEIQNSGLAPSDGAESAIIATLNPGSYTAIVRGVGGSTGIGMAEVYDLGERGSGTRLGNISTRGFVQPNDQVMIGGIIVVRQPTKVVVRALGPSLRRFGIANALSNPQVELHDANGTIARNDDWQTTQIGGVITADQTTELLNSGLAPDDPAESAMIVTLQPGNYTAVLKGVNGTSGVALVEVYALP